MVSKVVFVAAFVAVHLCSAYVYNPMNNRHGKATGFDWWETSVFYQIYPRSFMDSDGDGVGDLQGIIGKLDHLKDAGIGATWLSPIMKSPMKDFGYDIEDFYDIDPIFGTMADFDALMEKAKTLEIKIIMDLVPNHSSDLCEWFKDSVNQVNGKGDWYIWEDPIWVGSMPTPPNNWVSVFRGSAWEYNPVRGQYYLHQFTKEQPDLNYRNPAVVEEMKSVISFWLDKGIGGFRIDAINHLFETDRVNNVYPDEPRNEWNDDKDDYGYVDHIYTKDLDETYWMVYEWRKLFDTYYEKDNITRVMMTEAYTDLNKTMLYYGNGTSTGSHIPFNFGLINEINEDSTANQLEDLVKRWIYSMPVGKTANWVIGNHDQARVATRYGMERIDGLNMIVLLLPGAAVTYNGEEIGMSNTDISWEDTTDPAACNTNDPINYWKSSRDPARTPFQWDNSTYAGFSTTTNKTWLPVNPNYKEINLQLEKDSPRSHYKIYKRLAELRNLQTFVEGRLETYAMYDDIFMFARKLEGHETYVVIINMRSQSYTVNIPFAGLPSDLIVVETSIQSNKDISSWVGTHSVEIIPYESLVLKTSPVQCKVEEPISCNMCKTFMENRCT